MASIVGRREDIFEAQRRGDRRANIQYEILRFLRLCVSNAHMCDLLRSAHGDEPFTRSRCGGNGIARPDVAG